MPALSGAAEGAAVTPYGWSAVGEDMRRIGWELHGLPSPSADPAASESGPTESFETGKKL